ncbi:hypothetical protein EGN69_14630 [Pseudomonas monteilii]|nr:hypothetical protein EGN69_14630 [Pseudomonas monteilii]
MIGLVARLYVVANGRIAGISGLLGSLLQRTGEGRGETLFLLLGIIAAPLLWRAVSAVPPVRFSTAPGLLMVAGYWWGRYGSGCTLPSRMVTACVFDAKSVATNVSAAGRRVIRR